MGICCCDFMLCSHTGINTGIFHFIHHQLNLTIFYIFSSLLACNNEKQLHIVLALPILL